MTWFRVGGAGIPAALKNAMNAVFNKKFGTSGQNYPPKQWPDDVNLLGPLPEGTASGSIAHITDGADEVPIKSWEVEIAPTLTGKSAIECTQTGKNLLKLNDGTYSIGSTGATATILNGEISITGTTVNSSGRTTRLSDYFVLHTGTYYISPVISTSPYVRSYLNKKSDNTAVGYSSGSAFTVSEDTEVYFGINVEGGKTYNTTLTPQLEVGSTATAYEPYTAPTTHTANLGRTIYGGTADVVAGTGSTKVHKQTYTGDNVGAVSITYGQSAEGYTHLYFNIADIPLAYNPTSDNVISNITLPWNNNASAAGIPAVGECWRLINGGGPQKPIIYMYIHQIWASVNAFKAWLNENPITIVYEVETETDFTFDGQEINSLYGVNNFWSDAGGDTTVVYRRDIDLALQTVSSSRGLMMASRPVTQLVGEESDPDQVNELVENDETEQEGEDNAR